MSENKLVIRLYDHREERFDGNGIAALSEVSNPLITHEKNGEYSFKFEFKKSHHFYNFLEPGRFVKVNDTVFIVRVIDEYAAGDTVWVDVFCEHILFELLDDFLPFLAHRNSTVQYILNSILFKSRFKGSSSLLVPGGINMQITRGSVLKALDRTSKNANGIRLCSGMPNQYGLFEIKVIDNSGVPVGTLIHNRKNSKSIRRITNGNDIITRLYPYGEEGLTIEGARQGNGKEFIDADNINSYNRPRERGVQWEHISDPDTLYDVAVDHLKKINKPRNSYEVEVDFIAKEIGFKDGEIDVGANIIIIDEPLNARFETVISKITYDPSPDSKTAKVVLEEALPSLDKLISDMMDVEETDTGVRRGNVWTEFVTIPFAMEETTVAFSVPYATKPVVNCHVIGNEHVPLIVNYIEEIRNEKPVWTAVTIKPKPGNYTGKDITMMAIGRIDLSDGGFA